MNSAINPIGWREYESAPQANPATLDALRELAVSLHIYGADIGVLGSSIRRRYQLEVRQPVSV